LLRRTALPAHCFGAESLLAVRASGDNAILPPPPSPACPFQAAKMSEMRAGGSGVVLPPAPHARGGEAELQPQW